jgi:hypothetical protein
MKNPEKRSGAREQQRAAGADAGKGVESQGKQGDGASVE